MELLISGKHGKNKVALISPQDYNRVHQYKWWLKIDKNRQYIKTSILLNKKRIYPSLHRFIMGIPKGKEIDHINGNPFDNRRENLRICTRSENVRNIPIRKDSKNHYRGVVFIKKKLRWRARIQINGKRYSSSKTYKTEKEAAIRFNEMAKQYHGEFARLNNMI